MKIQNFSRLISACFSFAVMVNCMTNFLTANAALLDGYEDNYESEGKTYQSLGILEDQYDLIEPENNRFPVISPNSKYDKSYPPLFIGTYGEVETYFAEQNMTDGLPVVPPTKVKAEKFIGYSAYGYDDVIATVNGRKVKTYMVAANAIMAGCSPEHLPVCIAFTEALGNKDYLDSLKSGKLTPMMYVNGPAAHQIGIDDTQGMTTEEANIAIGRFIELALINFADIQHTNAFGNIQPLVFSENDEACLTVGWKPHHVEEGYSSDETVITATSFSMWGNNVTPATDLPEEIMKIIAWDITEKNLGALGSASVEENADTHRIIFITEPVAQALSKKYSSKDELENALVKNARRPLSMRAYAYYYANTDNALNKSFDEVYYELKSEEEENAKLTSSPPWLNGITYSEIDTVATMKKGNTDIIVTGDSSRNKTQVMPGGISVTKKVKLSDNWNQLVTSVNYPQIEHYNFSEQDNSISPPEMIPSVLTDGTYRILDPVYGESNLTRAGRMYYDSEQMILHYYANGASGANSVQLDENRDAMFIAYLTNIGYNSSFTVSNGKLTDIIIRFSSNEKKLQNNTVALTDKSFSGMNLTVHANQTSNSNTAGGVAKDGATAELSSTVTSFTVNLDGDIVIGDTTNKEFIKLNGTKITVNPSVQAGASAIIESINKNNTYRIMTFVNGGDGTYTITYNAENTLSLFDSTFCLEGSFDSQNEHNLFRKTDNPDIITLTKDLPAGEYTIQVHNLATDKLYGKNNTTITDTTNRLVLVNAENACVWKTTGGKYEFKYEISTNRLSIYSSNLAISGDCNADGKFNLADVVLLQKWLLAIPNTHLNEWKAADLCENNKIDIFDLTAMKNLLLNG